MIADNSPLGTLFKFFSNFKRIQRGVPCHLNANLEQQALHLALDVAHRPSVKNFLRALQFTVDLGGFANTNAKKLKTIHPDLDVEICTMWRRSIHQRTSLEDFPPKLDFLKKFLPFYYLREKFGDVLQDVPDLPVLISVKEAQEIAMLLLVLPSFVSTEIRRTCALYFYTKDPNVSLLSLMKKRKTKTMVRITSDVRTVYNTMVKFGKIQGHTSRTVIEPCYGCAIRLATLIIRGKLTLQSIISVHKILIFDKKNILETVCTKMSRLLEFLESVTENLDLTPLREFLDSGKEEFDSPPATHQSDPLPAELIAYEVQTNLHRTHRPHLQLRAASVSLMVTMGIRIGCLMSHYRVKMDDYATHYLTTFSDSKTKKPGGKCQQIAIPKYDHIMCPSRALAVLDNLVGQERGFLLGYVPRARPVCPENFRPFTRGSITRLISEMIAEAPLYVRGLVEQRAKITPNTWRFTSEAIRIRAHVSERCRIHAKQHKPKNMTEHYALTNREIIDFGQQLEKFWKKLDRILHHKRAMSSSSKRRVSNTYSTKKKPCTKNSDL